MTRVYIAWYHDGFHDNPEEIIEVCSTDGRAKAAIAWHKEVGERIHEYKDKASWRVSEHALWADEKGGE